MKYFIIAGEASGDLHASHLMEALRQADSSAEFRCYGGDRMSRAGGTLLCHYRTLAYMGFVQVALHLPAILRGLRTCKRQIISWRPDAVILVDYPGFNLKVARFVKRKSLCPVFYYISPKIWAWKERRIHAIRQDVTHLYSILPFEKNFFEGKHGYPITYVGNPTVDEVTRYMQHHGSSCSDGRTVALLPGSRRQEVSDNLSRMLQAVSPLGGYRLAIAVAPAIEADFYRNIISQSGIDAQRVDLVQDDTYGLLSHACAALVTSGTATLETALFGVPQIVCYYMRCGWLVSRLRPYFLKVPFISLVNLVIGREVVPELVANAMNPVRVRRELEAILPGGRARSGQLAGYEELKSLLGESGAPQRAARDMVARLSGR